MLPGFAPRLEVMKIHALATEHGNNYLFERLYDDPRVMQAYGQMKVVTRSGPDPHNPEVALELSVAKPEGGFGTVVAVMDFTALHVLLSDLERRYGRHVGEG